jgi:hypothetical protein
MAKKKKKKKFDTSSGYDVAGLRKTRDRLKRMVEGGKFMRLPEGDTVIRIVPPIGKMGRFYIEGGTHYEIGEDAEAVVCPQLTNKEDCPICEATEELFATKNAEDVLIAKNLKASSRFYVNVINYTNATEKRKGVQVMNVGVKLIGEIIDYFCDSDYGDIASLKFGRCLTINRTGKGKYDTSYSVRPKPVLKPISKSDIKGAEDLTKADFVQAKTYDELKDLLDSTDTESSGEVDTSEMTMDELLQLIKDNDLEIKDAKRKKLKELRKLVQDELDADDTDDDDDDDGGDDDADDDNGTEEVELDEMSKKELLVVVKDNDLKVKGASRLPVDELREQIAEQLESDDDADDDSDDDDDDDSDDNDNDDNFDDMDKDELIQFIKDNELEISVKKAKKMKEDALRELVEDTWDVDDDDDDDAPDLDEMDKDELLEYIKDEELDIGISTKKAKKKKASALRALIQETLDEDDSDDSDDDGDDDDEKTKKVKTKKRGSAKKVKTKKRKRS